uniref:Uncharacterized protein n=1 Tax=Myotis myotis TaxID=51298 RepID=A0A7J7Y3F1_MYOMY|nr:hypothetical protein mMyoMyo1_017985 [Myotis myotis]
MTSVSAQLFSVLISLLSALPVVEAAARDAAALLLGVVLSITRIWGTCMKRNGEV